MKNQALALHGGNPVRDTFLPYSRQTLDNADRAAVSRVLDSDFLTTGPEVAAFEQSLTAISGVSHAAAVSSGTAALHCMMDAFGIGPGDEVIVPTITFAATANAVRYVGAQPVFADVDPTNLLIDPECVESLVTDRTKAVVAVDFAGQAADYARLKKAVPANVHILADAAHSIGGSLDGVPVGAIAEASCFSFHPVKPVAAGEGGAVVSDDAAIIESVKSFRNHGIDSDHIARAKVNTWEYQMTRLGYNYRMTDIQCALGTSQLSHMEERRSRREEIAARFDSLIDELPGITYLAARPGVKSAHHLYVIAIELERFSQDRTGFFNALRAENIGVNVHYVPVPNHPYYKKEGAPGGPWPNSDAMYPRILSLPLWSGMSDSDSDDVLEALVRVSTAFRR